jgi:nitrite reductase/ring-hydroxylating ferredoxin subunit/DMSO/TMAO reductase YedYZ heme-binding membrane subunit
MSVHYEVILWNGQKRIYDACMAGLVIMYVVAFIGVGALVDSNATEETLIIRAFGTAALLLLHVILCIGPLCRLDARFLPLLYNRRHMGVTMFLLALVHGVFSIVQFHALGDVNPLVSVLSSNPRIDSIAQFPFEMLGVLALVILFVMAATSHDFWLHTLTPHTWKRIHMLIYVAYWLLVGHVLLGALQSERNPVLTVVLGIGVLMVTGLHLAAAHKERAVDHERRSAEADGFVSVCDVSSIPEKCAQVVTVGSERVAVFRYGGRVSAVSNVCRHQNGPLGEGRIIDGCITCPWHGYQYLPDTGMSPPPYNDKVPVYRTWIVGDRVFVHPRP